MRSLLDALTAGLCAWASVGCEEGQIQTGCLGEVEIRTLCVCMYVCVRVCVSVAFATTNVSCEEGEVQAGCLGQVEVRALHVFEY